MEKGNVNINQITLQDAFKGLSPLQLMLMVNGLIDLMYERGADIVDFDDNDYRIEKIFYSKKDDEFYFEWIGREK